MGIFDDLIDTIVDLPGKVVKETVKTVIRIPEIVIKTGKGVVEGVEEGIEKIEDLVD